MTTAAICSAVASPQDTVLVQQQLAPAVFSLRRHRVAGGGVTAVCLGGPPSADSTDGGSSSPKVCSYTRRSNHARHALRLHTDGCASCASAVTAMATALITPCSSHRARPTALDPPRSSLRAHPSALIPPRDCCAHVCRLSVRLLKCCTSARLLLPHNLIIFSEFKSCNFCTWRDYGADCPPA